MNLAAAALATLLLAAAAEDAPPSLRRLKTVPLAVAEPSGLCRTAAGTLLVVGDGTGRIDTLDLEGNRLASQDCGLTGLEAITVDGGGTRWVVQEEARMVSRLGPDGRVQAQFPVAILGAANKGPEGLAWHPGLGVFLLLKEGRPGALYRWDPARGILDRRLLGFAEDYSDLACDPDGESLWLLSDQSGTLTRTDLQGRPLETWRTGVAKAEGVVVDRAAGRVWLVSDSAGTLCVLAFP